MNDYPYKLTSNKYPKINCPYCGAVNHWQRYIDTTTGQLLPDQYGKCDNENKCGKWNDPYKLGYGKNQMVRDQENSLQYQSNWTPPARIIEQPPNPDPVFFDFETFRQTLNPEFYEMNTFFQNLLNRVLFPFDIDEVTKVIELYRLGTISNGLQAGAITFPFIDIQENIRTIQVKQFDKTNHTTGTDFLHSIIEKQHTRNKKQLPEWLEAYIKQQKFVSCLFGEHLLKANPGQIVALVEAPKTAIYCWLYFNKHHITKNWIWLAVGAMGYFTFERIKVLKGRSVFVFPDLSKDGSTFKKWETKAKEFEKRLPGTKFNFSDFLEQFAPETDRINGNDIADYLIKTDWHKYRTETKQIQTPLAIVEPTDTHVQQNIESVNPISKDEIFNPGPFSRPGSKEPRQNWNDQIKALETFFENYQIPCDPVKLSKCEIITDVQLFIKSHLEIIKDKNGCKAYLPDLERLQKLMIHS